MQTPQGAQLTGTNRPRTWHTPTHPRPPGAGHASTVRFPGHGPHPPAPREGTAPQPDTVPGGHSEGETPGPIPNPEVKPSSADGTAREASRESRTPPEHTTEGRPDIGPALLFSVHLKPDSYHRAGVRRAQSCDLQVCGWRSVDLRTNGALSLVGGVRSHGKDGLGSDRGAGRVRLPARLADHGSSWLGA